MQYLFSDEKTARKITKHHSKPAQAILDAIAWIRDKLGIKTSDTETLMRMYGKMYNEVMRNVQNGVAHSAASAYNGVKNSIAQNNEKLIRYYNGKVREGDGVYLSNKDKAIIAHNVKSGNGWMNESTNSGYVYTDNFFYTFDFNSDHSITVTQELFIDTNVEKIDIIRKEFSVSGATVRGNDSTLEGKKLRPEFGAEYSVTGNSGRGLGRASEIHGQPPGGRRLRTDNGSGQNHEKSFTASETQNKVKADSNESAFSNGDGGSRSSIFSTDALDIDFGRRINAARQSA